MNAATVINLIKAMGNRLESGDKWQASHHINREETDVRPVVSSFDTGIKDGQIWFEFEFKEDGGSHTLKGTFDLGNKGEEILFDGDDVDSDDVWVRGIVQTTRLRGAVVFKFATGGVQHRYRFDATLMSA